MDKGKIDAFAEYVKEHEARQIKDLDEEIEYKLKELELTKSIEHLVFSELSQCKYSQFTIEEITGYDKVKENKFRRILKGYRIGAINKDDYRVLQELCKKLDEIFKSSPSPYELAYEAINIGDHKHYNCKIYVCVNEDEDTSNEE